MAKKIIREPKLVLKTKSKLKAEGAYKVLQMQKKSPVLKFDSRKDPYFRVFRKK